MASLGYLRAEHSGTSAPADADTAVRSLLLVAVFLLVWISFHPFQSLDVPPEVQGGIAAEGNSPKRLARATGPAAVVPWAGYQIIQMIRIIFF